MVIEETVHLTSSTSCPSASLLAHELTHVWQFQRGEIFTDGFPGIISWLHKQSTERDTMYGFDLEENKGLLFRDYGWEQQASIVAEAFVVWRDTATIESPLDIIYQLAK